MGYNVRMQFLNIFCKSNDKEKFLVSVKEYSDVACFLNSVLGGRRMMVFGYG